MDTLPTTTQHGLQVLLLSLSRTDDDSVWCWLWKTRDCAMCQVQNHTVLFQGMPSLALENTQKGVWQGCTPLQISSLR